MAKTLYVPVESLLDGYVSKEAKEIYVPVSDNGTYKSKRAVKAYCPDENGLSKLFWETAKFGVYVKTSIHNAYASVGPVTVTTSIRNYTP